MPPLQTLTPLNLGSPIWINKKGQDFELINNISVEKIIPQFTKIGQRQWRKEFIYLLTPLITYMQQIKLHHQRKMIKKNTRIYVEKVVGLLRVKKQGDEPNAYELGECHSKFPKCDEFGFCKQIKQCQ